VRDLNDEKIDVIEWNSDPESFIAKALSPARVSGVYLDEDPDRGKTAIVVVPEDQLSLAIGRSGVNARLGAKLTGWRIDIKSLPEAAVEALRLLETDPLFSKLAEAESENTVKVGGTLTKKAENRPIPPEEYQTLTQFVDRIQRAVMSERDAARTLRREKLEIIRQTIPLSAYEVPLEEIGLAARVLNLLVETDYVNAGQVMEQLELDEDKILGLQGFGPKAMEELRTKLSEYEFPEVEIVAEPEILVEEAIDEVELEVVPEVEEAISDEEPVVVGAEAAVEMPAEAVVDEAPAVEVPAEAVEEPVEEVPMEPIEEIVEEVPEELDEVDLEKALPIETEEDLEKVFAGLAEGLGSALEPEEEMDDDVDEISDTKRKKRKKRARVVEYDPDLGETVVRRRRKRGGAEEWDDYDV
jgi:N utilization substance protein A